MKQRIEYIDLAKGFCIMLVVFNHGNVLMGDPEYALRDAFCIMRMPLYFFLSGLFFKPYENYSGFLKRKINKLLIPFLFFRIVSCLIGPVFNKTEIDWGNMFDFLVGQMHAPNTPIWFLICLFWLNQIFYGIYKVSSQTKWFTPVLTGLSLLIGICGYYLGKTDYNILAMNISTALTAIPFFCAGYLFKSHTQILYPNQWDKYLWIFILGSALYTFTFAKATEYFSNQYEANAWETYSCGLAGILCVLFISKLIKKLPLISYFGRFSIIILVTHMPLIQRVMPLVFRLHLPYWWMESILGTIIVLLASLVIIPLCLRFFPYVTAQKDLIPIKTDK